MSPKPPRAVFFPDFKKLNVAALQALSRGVANDAQQVRALKHIVEELCGAYSDTFDPTSERLSDFAQGRRSVGLEIVKILALPLDSIPE